MAWKRLFVDVRPLRVSPDFRRQWIGAGLSMLGSQLTTVAVALQVFTLTRSSIAVGMIALIRAVVAIGLAPIGGVVADALDRRRIVLWSNVGLALVSVALAGQALLGSGSLWLLYLLVGAQSVLSALDIPARGTFMARLLPADLLPAGAALRLISFRLSSTVGPALAGLIAGLAGLKLCYLVDAATFLCPLYAVFRLPPMPPQGGAVRPGPRALGEAARFVAGNRVIAGAFLADISACALGMPMALFPAINAERFGGGAQTLGYLFAAPAIGGMIAALLSGPAGRVTRQGRALLLAAAVWGGFLTAFGVADRLWLAVACLALAGMADSVSVVFRTAIVQAATPDQLRGRVGAAEYLVGGGMPQLGSFRAGAVGSLTSSTFSAVSGGLTTIIAAGVLGVAMPALTRYRAAVPDPAVAPVP